MCLLHCAYIMLTQMYVLICYAFKRQLCTEYYKCRLSVDINSINTSHEEVSCFV